MPATHWYRNKIFTYSYLLLIAGWLITISFIIDNYWAKNATITRVKNILVDYLSKQQQDFERTISDTALLRKIGARETTQQELEQITGKKYLFYIYDTNSTGKYKLQFWNTNIAVPPDSLVKPADSTGFAQLTNGYYVWNRILYSGKIFLQLIPVKWNYAVTNEYLKNNFANKVVAGNAYTIDTATGESVRDKAGNTLFYVVQQGGNIISQNNDVSVIFRLLGVLFILLYIYLKASALASNNHPVKAVILFPLIIIGLRIISYYFPVPLNFRQFDLFDPTVYGSSAILRSLGDLLINALLFVLIVYFVIRHSRYLPQIHFDKKPFMKWLMLAGTSCLQLVITFSFGHVVRSLIADSQISFDVINFFSLNSFSVIGFFILASLSLAYFYFTQYLFGFAKAHFRRPALTMFSFILIGGLIFLTWQMFTNSSNFELFLLIWLCIYTILSFMPFFRVNIFQLTTTKFISWLFLFSLSVTLVIVIINDKKEYLNRQHYAESLSTRVNPSSETLMNTLLTDFRNEVLAPNFYRFKNAAAAQKLKDSLTIGNFSSLTNKYDTRIYCFDDRELPLSNTDSASFNTLNAIYTAQAKPTGITDLFYYDESYDRFSYIAKKTVKDTAKKLLGYVFILASPKRSGTDALYPELFSRGEHFSIENSSVYAFAVYNNLKLVMHHNDYPFATELKKDENKKADFYLVKNGGYNELWYNAGSDKMVVIAKQDRLFLESITLFSYLFCSLLLLTAGFWLLRALILLRFKVNMFNKLLQVSIRSQVHGVIILVIVISFIIIATGTILFFISRYENSNREKLSRTINVMEKEMRNSLADLTAFDDVVQVFDDAYKARLEQTVKKISEIHAADINVYDLNGNLQISSLALPYQKGIISTKMNPIAFHHLHNNKEIQYFLEEKIGGLNYLSNYIPVIDETGKEYAYLNIPYFTSESKLRQEISNFLVTIINLNAFIFLIAGILALFITNRITHSFELIGAKMKELKLGKANEAIEWNRNDEIGQLVEEYNKMVGKLDESAELLAKTEREGAWREMARQVAHEIRNPLTPMKLSLQYLQKAIDSNAPNVRELTMNVANTLVDQIEHLNSISAGFLQFANIDKPANTVFNLNEIIRSVAGIHGIHDNVKMILNLFEGEVKILADATHINRLFTNLIQNAIQASDGRQATIINISQTVENGQVITAVTDTGTGITDEAREKIFTPNFTTKSSGSGLGLAMSKGIVEKAGGKIWFISEENAGTAFFVQLPLATE